MQVYNVVRATLLFTMVWLASTTMQQQDRFYEDETTEDATHILERELNGDTTRSRRYDFVDNAGNRLVESSDFPYDFYSKPKTRSPESTGDNPVGTSDAYYKQQNGGGSYVDGTSQAYSTEDYYPQQSGYTKGEVVESPAEQASQQYEYYTTPEKSKQVVGKEIKLTPEQKKLLNSPLYFQYQKYKERLQEHQLGKDVDSVGSNVDGLSSLVDGVARSSTSNVEVREKPTPSAMSIEYPSPRFDVDELKNRQTMKKEDNSEEEFNLKPTATVMLQQQKDKEKERKKIQDVSQGVAVKTKTPFSENVVHDAKSGASPLATAAKIVLMENTTEDALKKEMPPANETSLMSELDEQRNGVSLYNNVTNIDNNAQINDDGAFHYDQPTSMLDGENEELTEEENNMHINTDSTMAVNDDNIPVAETKTLQETTEGTPLKNINTPMEVSTENPQAQNIVEPQSMTQTQHLPQTQQEVGELPVAATGKEAEHVYTENNSNDVSLLMPQNEGAKSEQLYDTGKTGEKVIVDQKDSLTNEHAQLKGNETEVMGNVTAGENTLAQASSSGPTIKTGSDNNTNESVKTSPAATQEEKTVFSPENKESSTSNDTAPKDGEVKEGKGNEPNEEKTISKTEEQKHENEGEKLEQSKPDANVFAQDSEKPIPVKEAEKKYLEVNQTGPNEKEFGKEEKDFGAKEKEFGTEEREFGTKEKEFGTVGKEFGTIGKEFGTKGKEVAAEEKEAGKKGKEFGTKGKEFGTIGKKFGKVGKEFGTIGKEFGTKDKESGTNDNNNTNTDESKEESNLVNAQNEVQLNSNDTQKSFPSEDEKPIMNVTQQELKPDYGNAAESKNIETDSPDYSYVHNETSNDAADTSKSITPNTDATGTEARKEEEEEKVQSSKELSDSSVKNNTENKPADMDAVESRKEQTLKERFDAQSPSSSSTSQNSSVTSGIAKSVTEGSSSRAEESTTPTTPETHQAYEDKVWERMSNKKKEEEEKKEEKEEKKEEEEKSQETSVAKEHDANNEQSEKSEKELQTNPNNSTVEDKNEQNDTISSEDKDKETTKTEKADTEPNQQETEKDSDEQTAGENEKPSDDDSKLTNEPEYMTNMTGHAEESSAHSPEEPVEFTGPNSSMGNNSKESAEQIPEPKVEENEDLDTLSSDESASRTQEVLDMGPEILPVEDLSLQKTISKKNKTQAQNTSIVLTEHGQEHQNVAENSTVRYTPAKHSHHQKEWSKTKNSGSDNKELLEEDQSLDAANETMIDIIEDPDPSKSHDDEEEKNALDDDEEAILNSERAEKDNEGAKLKQKLSQDQESFTKERQREEGMINNKEAIDQREYDSRNEAINQTVSGNPQQHGNNTVTENKTNKDEEEKDEDEEMLMNEKHQDKHQEEQPALSDEQGNEKESTKQEEQNKETSGKVAESRDQQHDDTENSKRPDEKLGESRHTQEEHSEKHSDPTEDEMLKEEDQKATANNNESQDEEQRLLAEEKLTEKGDEHENKETSPQTKPHNRNNADSEYTTSKSSMKKEPTITPENNESEEDKALRAEVEMTKNADINVKHDIAGKDIPESRNVVDENHMRLPTNEGSSDQTNTPEETKKTELMKKADQEYTSIEEKSDQSSTLKRISALTDWLTKASKLLQTEHTKELEDKSPEGSIKRSHTASTTQKWKRHKVPKRRKQISKRRKQISTRRKHMYGHRIQANENLRKDNFIVSNDHTQRQRSQKRVKTLKNKILKKLHTNKLLRRNNRHGLRPTKHTKHRFFMKKH